jgi:hypothetical protein
MIERAKRDGQVSGLIPHLVDGGISILQYADDTILFMDHDLDKALNMKLILCLFEQLSGLKIIFTRVRFFVLGKPKIWNLTIRLYLGATLGLCHSDTWEFQCTFES